MYTKIGCALFDTLATTPEGSKYLSQNKILRLIADGLAQLDPVRTLSCKYMFCDTFMEAFKKD